ncbi:DUF3788 family protein [bacterium]|nr:DUF3788 family protein [bacterium]
MAVSDDFLIYVLDQLSTWSEVTARKMFGGVGLYRDGKMFGLIADDVVYLKVDNSNRDDFLQAGSAPFKPYTDKPPSMSYYEVPSEVLEEPEELVKWAKRSLTIQKKKKSDFSHWFIDLSQEKNMEKPCLNNQNEYPDDDVLSRYLGKVKNTWDSFMNLLKESYPLFSGEWRYYRDGKSWLFKVTKRKKTICWVSIYPNQFKTTFYFDDKAEDLITKSKLKREYIDQFLNGKRYEKIRAITVEIKKSADLNTTKTLIEIKEQLK